MSDLGKLIVRYLGDKVKLRTIIESSDLFDMFNNMGIVDDIESLRDVLDYFDENEIDINFKVGEEKNHRRFKLIEGQIKMMKRLKINRERSKQIIKKLDEIKPKLENDWLEQYRMESDDEFKDDGVIKPFVNPELDNLNNRIQNQIRERMIEQLNQMTDEERLEHAVNLFVDTNNSLNNN